MVLLQSGPDCSLPGTNGPLRQHRRARPERPEEQQQRFGGTPYQRNRCAYDNVAAGKETERARPGNHL